MKTNTIQEAIQMINSHDWFWMMSEEYTRSYNSAKASMRAFVALVNTISNKDVRDSLRSLWMLRYENARNTINGQSEENNTKEVELMNTIALAA